MASSEAAGWPAREQVNVAVAPLGFLPACVGYVVANGGVRGLIIMGLWRADGT